MIFETIKTAGVAHYSYLFGDAAAGACVVIDPRRDVDIYLQLAQKHNVQIQQILETHIHADFISGSTELFARTGAPIGVGAADHYGFEHQTLSDGDKITVGKFQLRVLETPGHTPEHICFLVSGGEGTDAPWGLFSGDTLFAGEVGRPDLLGDGTEEKLAHQLYHSLHDKLLPLGDTVVIYPAHGEGSPCGASIGERETSTIGYERQNNPSLSITDEDKFVKRLLQSQTPAPAYYPRMKKINAAGPTRLETLPYVPALTAETFGDIIEKAGTDNDAVILDVRAIEAFGGAHIAGAINIADREPLPVWVGHLLQPEQPLFLVTPNAAAVTDTILSLLRVGYTNIKGYLAGGMASWFEAGLPHCALSQLDVHTLHSWIEEGKPIQLLDVRGPDEWETGHIPQACHRFLPNLEKELEGLDPSKPTITYCASGYRASIAASLLQHHKFENVYTVPGSMMAWQAAGFELTK